MSSNISTSDLQELAAIVTLPNGQQYGAPLFALDDLEHQFIQMGVQFGARIGSAIILGTLLALVARSYRSLLFVMYQTNLLLMVISASLEIAYLESFSRTITDYYLELPLTGHDMALSVSTTLFNTLLTWSIVITLVIQIYTAFSDTRRRTQLLVMSGCIIGCVPCFMIYFARLILGGMYTLDPDIADVDDMGNVDSYQWVWAGQWTSFAATIAVGSAVLCGKLWAACQKRQRLGMETLDPIKIIFVMATQNSVFSSILLIIAAATSGYVQRNVGAAAIPVTACLLPVGYIWAQVQQLKGSTEPGSLSALAAQSGLQAPHSHPGSHMTYEPDSPSEAGINGYLEKIEQQLHVATFK